ncbi:MAG: hypothetical protein HS111_20440 [Kofleriaceae bacterium]|nr:hypothetical protein [Kofleriaceae bacterium]
MRCASLFLLTVGAGVAAACGFHPSGASEDGDGAAADAAAIDAAGDGDGAPPTDATVTTDARCRLGFVDLCGAGAAGPALTVSAATSIDTDTDPRCATLAQPGGPDACLVWVASVSIGVGARLTATGSRPLVIASAGDLVVDGVVDVSSRRGQARGAGAATECATPRAPENDAGGAAGGAGGSFGSVGGAGGTGDTDQSLGGDGTALGGLPGSALAVPPFARAAAVARPVRAAPRGERRPGRDRRGDQAARSCWRAFGAVRVTATGQVLAGSAAAAAWPGPGRRRRRRWLGGYIGLEGARPRIAGALAATRRRRRRCARRVNAPQ